MTVWLFYLLALVVAMVVSSLLCELVIKMGERWKIVDDPAKHLHPKVTHQYPVPRGGGLVVCGSIVLSALLFMPMNIKTLGILAGVLLLAATGWLDDRYEEKISPYFRLVVNVLAAGCVIGVGLGIAYITNPLGGILKLSNPQWCFMVGHTMHCVWVWADLFTLIWLVWLQNIVGWSSGVDGQLPGFVIIAAITMTVLAVRFGTDSSQWGVIILSGITAGAYLGFLLWNMYPQKIMPGYGGKSIAGFLLGVLAIMSGARVGAMMMVLGVPLIDGVLVIVKRIREKRNPVWGGREHLHYYLLELGWSKKRIAVFYWLVSLVMAILALELHPPSKYFTMATIVVIIGGIILWFHYFSTFLKQPDRDSG